MGKKTKRRKRRKRTKQAKQRRGKRRKQTKVSITDGEPIWVLSLLLQIMYDLRTMN